MGISKQPDLGIADDRSGVAGSGLSELGGISKGSLPPGYAYVMLDDTTFVMLDDNTYVIIDV